MHDLSHPPDAPLRRRSLLAATLLSAAGMHSAWAQSAPTPTVLTLALPEAATTTTLGFNVASVGEGEEQRIAFAALRSTVRIAAISLLDPARRRVWRLTLAELAFRDRATVGQPELGDAYRLPDVRGAAAGRWSLVVERERPLSGAGRIQLAYAVFPRFEIDITIDTPQPAAGQPLLLAVRPRDHGAPVPGLPGIVVQVTDSGGAPVASAQAVEGLRSRAGVVLSEELGVYRAAIILERPGRYRLLATQVFASKTRPVARSAALPLQVAAAAGGLQLVGLRVQPGSGGCVRALLLDFAVQAAAAGIYACNLTLRGGDPAAPRANASADLAAGPGRITVAVDATKLAVLGPAWVRLERAVLVFIAGADFRIVAELNDIDLAPFGVAWQPLCK